MPIKINTDTYFTIVNPSMAINHQGRLFVIWQHFNERPYNLKARLYFSSYDGQNWSHEVAITDTDGTAWTPDIAVDTLGLPHVVWGEYSSGEIYHQWHDGTTWSEPENVSQNSGASFAPRIAIDKKNRIHVVWHDDTPGNWTIFYRYFDAASWSATVSLSDSLYLPAYPSIALDAKDNVHVAFHCYTGPPPLNNYDIFYRTCTAGVWSDLTRLTNDTLESYYAAVAVKPDNLPVVVWQQVVDITANPGIVRVYSTTFDGLSWTTPTSIADSSQSYGPRIAIERSGRAHVVWLLWDPVLRTQKIMYNSSNGGTWNVPSNIAGSTPGPSQPRIGVDTAGLCHVVLIAEGNGIYYTYQTEPDGIAHRRWQIPKTVVLEQNYPNPFNPTTVIGYHLPLASEVKLSVYDVLGREVSVLVNERKEAGFHEVQFDGTGISSGVYFYRLTAGDFVQTRKLVLLR